MGAPSPPDPYEVSGAQGAANREAALASGFVNNPTLEVTPYGTRTRTINGSYESVGADGRPITLPTFEERVTLNEAGQRRQNSIDRIGQSALDAGERQMALASESLARPVNFDSMAQGFSRRGFQQIPLQAEIELSDHNTVIGDAGEAHNFGHPGRGSELNDNVLNQATGYSIANMPAQFRNMTERSAFSEDSFSADRQRVQNAFMARASEDLDRSRGQLETQLVNQGLTRGTRAFDDAMHEIRRAENDLRTQAVLAGGQEQSRLQAEMRAADAQNFQQDLGTFQANMGRQAQITGQNAAQAQFGNYARGQQFQAGLARQTNNNSAIQADFNRRLAAHKENNAAQQQRFDQALGRRTFANTGIAANNSNAIQEARFTNTARQENMNNYNAAAQWETQQREGSIQEGLLQRTHPLNEMTSMLSMNPVQVPTFPARYQQGISPPDVEGNVWRAYEAELANSQAMMGGLFGMGSSLLGGLFRMGA